MTENERYDWDLNGIWDYNEESDGYIESYEDITKLLNEQDAEIKRLECINRQLEERLDRSIALDMNRCGKYVYGVHGGSNDRK